MKEKIFFSVPLIISTILLLLSIGINHFTQFTIDYKTDIPINITNRNIIIFLSILCILSFIFTLLKFHKNNTATTNDNIYQKWETLYQRICPAIKLKRTSDQTTSDAPGPGLANNDSDNLFFIDFYKNLYHRSVNDAIKFQKLNFRWKLFIEFVFFIAAIAQCFLFLLLLNKTYYEQFFSSSYQNVVTAEGLLIAFFITIVIALKKHLDIMKYQETWSRHKMTATMYQHEMICFIEKLSSYSSLSDEEKINRFKTRCLEIDMDNRKRFSKNLEEKEKSLTEDLQILKIKE